ncbi:MAG: hypothetical protein ACREBD_29220 [Blastocatellia bacterium]
MKRKRARGDGFFAAAETLPYWPRGVLLGQQTGDSCVAACCRMLLFDQFPELRNNYRYSESFFRTALGTDQEGSTISITPGVLQSFGLARTYVYRKDLVIEDLRNLVRLAPVIAIVEAGSVGRLHALVVDEISADLVAIRDPLVEIYGVAYKISLDSFLPHWLDLKTGCGSALTVLE